MTTERDKGTLEIIEQVALDLFSVQGFAATGMRQIAKAAGISLASIYHHVASKEQLLFNIQETCLNKLVHRAREARSNAKSPIEWLEGIVFQHVEMHVTESKICRVTDDELWSLPESMHTQIVTLRDNYEAEWDACLQAGNKSGLMSVQELSFIRLALLDLCTGPNKWFQQGGRFTVQDLAWSYINIAKILVREPLTPSLRELTEKGNSLENRP